MMWSLRDPVRLQAEYQAIVDLEVNGWLSEVQWQVSDSRLVVDATITAHGYRYEVRLTYPEHFPLVPPFVQPRDKDAYWSWHQYGPGGSLCLELRPDNWNPAATGSHMLQSAFNLLNIENPLGNGDKVHAPSAHQAWPDWAGSQAKSLTLICDGTWSRLRQGSSSQPMLSRWFPTLSNVATLIHDEVDRESGQVPPVNNALFLGKSMPLHVFCCAIPVPEIVASGPELAQLLQVDLTEYTGSDELAILVLSKDKSQVFVGNWAGPFYQRLIHVISDAPDSRKAAVAIQQRLKVGLVGAGSVGSKMADYLVRAGIAELVVIDGDLMLPGNLARHALDWSKVGVCKAEGLAEHLKLINPQLLVEAIAMDLRWQQSPVNYSGYLDKLASCHIIIDATGDHPTRLLLAALASESGIPFLSVSVFEGGIGALVAPWLPDISPPFALGYQSYESYCLRESESRQVKLPITAGRPYEGIQADGTPMVADDADVGMAAAHATRLALDILGHPDDPALARWLILGFSKSWIFDGHGHNHLITLGSYTPPPPVSEVDNKRGLELLCRIIMGEVGNETPAS